MKKSRQAISLDFLDGFLEKSFAKIHAGKFSGEEYEFLNYLFSEGLIPFENQQTIPERLRQAEAIDSKTPGERYALAMGEGAVFREMFMSGEVLINWANQWLAETLLPWVGNPNSS